MSFSKEELREKINNLPLFEMRNTGTAANAEKENQDFKKAKLWKAIVEVGTDKEPVVYVRPSYHLLQFKDMFIPLLDNIEEDLYGYLMDYEGMCRLLVFPDHESLKVGDTRYGLLAINSVDCTAGIIVKFCIEQGSRRFIVPHNVAGLKKKHTKNVGMIVKDYISMVDQVKHVWKKIINEFPKYKLVTKESEEPYDLQLSDTLEKLEKPLGARLNKKMVERCTEFNRQGRDFTLWDLFSTAMGNFEDKKYKTDMHKEKRIEKLCKAIFDYALVLSL